MSETSSDVILLRSADEQDRYMAAFEDAGFSVRCEPVLSFTFPNRDALEEHLRDRHQFAAIIATSPRVATAIEHVFADETEIARSWRGAPAYVVGPKTAGRLQEVGLRPRGADAGDAATLADRIVGEEHARPLLFLCGNRRRDTLPDRLGAADVSFEEIVVYRTELRTDLRLPAEPDATWLAFFSPSGLEAVEQSDSVDLAGHAIAAIGPTTAQALEAAGHAVHAVADEPSPTGLVSAIDAAGHID